MLNVQRAAKSQTVTKWLTIMDLDGIDPIAIEMCIVGCAVMGMAMAVVIALMAVTPLTAVIALMEVFAPITIVPSMIAIDATIAGQVSAAFFFFDKA